MYKTPASIHLRMSHFLTVTAMGAFPNAGIVGGAGAARPRQQPHLRSAVPHLPSLQPGPAAAALLPAGTAAVPVQPQARPDVLEPVSTSFIGALPNVLATCVVHALDPVAFAIKSFGVCRSPGKKWRRLGRERTAGGVLKLAVAGTLPVLVVQVVLAWFSKIFQSHGEWWTGVHVSLLYIWATGKSATVSL